MNNIIRVISGFSGEVDRYYDLSEMDWKEANELRGYLKDHGYYIQNIFIDDLMMVRIGMELDKRDKEAKDKK